MFCYNISFTKDPLKIIKIYKSLFFNWSWNVFYINKMLKIEYEAGEIWILIHWMFQSKYVEYPYRTWPKALVHMAKHLDFSSRISRIHIFSSPPNVISYMEFPNPPHGGSFQKSLIMRNLRISKVKSDFSNGWNLKF